MIAVPTPADGAGIHAITHATVVFNQEEKECVDELWDEYQAQGADKSGYYFLVDKDAGRVLGYACYGPRALTDRTYDLYWIAVDPNARGGGIGKRLLAATEQAVRELGGRILVVETSGMEKYAPTRGFYAATGYLLEATLKDFYKDGDDLVIYTKRL